MQDEEWRPHAHFQEYAISSLGGVRNIKTAKVVKPTLNQHGYLKVNLRHEGRTHTRALNHLVGDTYLPPPIRDDFSSLIHRNNDRTDCSVDNILWRPRYFTIDYHMQFDESIWQRETKPMRDRKTNVVYPDGQAVAVEHGLLLKSLLTSIYNNTYVWPTYQMFFFVDS